MKVPTEFKKINSEGEILLLNGTSYGLKQAAIGFWKVLLKAHKEIGNS